MKVKPSALVSTIIVGITFCFSCIAKQAEYHITITNHLFYPAIINIPAHQKVRLIIHNTDDTPEEFDSFDLNREKVIFPQQKSTIFIGPLPPGQYHFFGEYHPNSAQGMVVVTELTGGEHAN